ncbi:Hypothetical predicted protein [Octopus vulgaris]|uniref:Uncharacterized protein n=1 Tax=Octopus vulgaris TaxID=6645 RepID=A0AA36FEQ6_OCTVU|nr:Hypothetical predicted protein [Octopus vulgaris]
MCDLTASEKSVVTCEQVKGKSTLEIFEIIGRYRKSVKKIVTAPTKTLKRADKGQPMAVSQRSQREAVKKPSFATGELFKSFGVTTMSRTTRCPFLKKKTTEYQQQSGFCGLRKMKPLPPNYTQ